MIDIIAVTVNVSGLAEGAYAGSVVITGDASNSGMTIPVTLVIEPLL